LWFPFTLHSELNPEKLIFLVYGLMVAVVLVAPLLARIGRQLEPQVRRFGPSGGRFRL
jgi:hypothetical protein